MKTAAEYAREQYERRTAAGNCPKCGEPSGERVYCQSCRTKKTSDVAARRARYHASGRCHCGRDRAPGSTQCPACRLTLRRAIKKNTAKRRAERRVAGDCLTCGTSAYPFIYCASCRTKMRAKKKACLARRRAKAGG